MKATLRALEDFKIWCKILTFLFHNSPQLLVAGDQLFCKSVWPPEELNAYNFPVTKSILNARYQGQNNKIRQCSAELMGDASLIMLWMSTKNAQVALRNICTVSLRKTNTSIDFVDVFLLLRISSQHPSLRFFTPAYIDQSCFGVKEFSRLQSGFKVVNNTLLGLSPVPQLLEQGLHAKAFQEKFLKELKIEECDLIL